MIIRLHAELLLHRGAMSRCIFSPEVTFTGEASQFSTIDGRMPKAMNIFVIS